jgi:hypothetical protein
MAGMALDPQMVLMRGALFGTLLLIQIVIVAVAIYLARRAPRGGQVTQKSVFLGLNKTGIVLLFLLFWLCVPTCWIVWLIPECRGTKQPPDVSPPPIP